MSTPMETLRRAAKEMRASAEKAEQGRWKLWGMQVLADPKETSNVDDAVPVADSYTPSWCDRMPRTWNATYIANMDPAVALAIASWLEATAERWSHQPDSRWDAAVEVAETYLRGAS